jgi:hypothetical protein
MAVHPKRAFCPAADGHLANAGVDRRFATPVSQSVVLPSGRLRLQSIRATGPVPYGAPMILGAPSCLGRSRSHRIG